MLQRLEQRFCVKSGPRTRGEEEFGVPYLPGEEVGDALLSARPYHQICIIQHKQHLRELEGNTSTHPHRDHVTRHA